MRKFWTFAIVLAGLIFVSCTKSEEGAEDKTGSIYGIVTELGSAEPMKAVGVELYDLSWDGIPISLLLKTVTFDDGHFEFKDLNPENYQVKVVADGYEQIEEGKVSVNAGRQARIDLQVKEVETGMVLKTTDATVKGMSVTLSSSYSSSSTWNAPTEVGFVYSNEINVSNGIKVKGTESGNSFTATVYNLSLGTYYVKSYAKNSYGTTYGAVKEFVITGYPAVSTLAASNISETTATLNGHIDYNGNPAYTERGFVYSNTFANPTVEDPESATTKKKVSGSSEDFSANVAGLTKDKTYYVRAYVSNSQGTWYGESLSFSTDFRGYVYIDNLCIQKQDLGVANWSTAKSMCEASRVGGFNDWRLPTIAELAILYTHKNEIGGFESAKYWSSSQYSTSSPSYKYYYDFSNGTQSNTNATSNNYRVRAVRTW